MSGVPVLLFLFKDSSVAALDPKTGTLSPLILFLFNFGTFFFQSSSPLFCSANSLYSNNKEIQLAAVHRSKQVED